jgi:hypothetical protein
VLDDATVEHRGGDVSAASAVVRHAIGVALGPLALALGEAMKDDALGAREAVADIGDEIRRPHDPLKLASTAS